MQPLEILTKAQDLIRNPDHWARDHFALNPEGEEVQPNSPEAACWCSLGAVMNVLDSDDKLTEHEVFKLLGKAIGDEACGGVPDFNDSASHAEVMSMFDKAIENARG